MARKQIIILDFDLDFLTSAATLVDASLERLDGKADASPDPDAFGIFDEAEYITGFGFVACNQKGQTRLKYPTIPIPCSIESDPFGLVCSGQSELKTVRVGRVSAVAQTVRSVFRMGWLPR